MSKRPMPLPDSRKPGKRKKPVQFVQKPQTWQVLARDMPVYSEKQPLPDPESFVYVQVAMLWPSSGKAALVDVLMSDAKEAPARFNAFFTGNCAGFFNNVKVSDKICLYLSDATFDRVEAQSNQNMLNLPFTLTWDKRCRLRHMERGKMRGFIDLPTRM